MDVVGVLVPVLLLTRRRLGEYNKGESAAYPPNGCGGVEGRPPHFPGSASRCRIPFRIFPGGKRMDAWNIPFRNKKLKKSEKKLSKKEMLSVLPGAGIFSSRHDHFDFFIRIFFGNFSCLVSSSRCPNQRLGGTGSHRQGQISQALPILILPPVPHLYLYADTGPRPYPHSA